MMRKAQYHQFGDKTRRRWIFASAGYRKSWATGVYKARTEGSALWELPAWLAMAILGCLLSWLGAIEAVYLICIYATDLGAPMAVRELQWRFRNVSLQLPVLIELSRKSFEARMGRALSADELRFIATDFAERLQRPELEYFFEEGGIAGRSRKTAALRY